MTNPENYIRILSDLIAFDTTSRNSNMALIDYIQSMLAKRNVVSELTHDESRTKANLFATIGGGNEPGIVLSGHTDVVPVDGQAWATDPFKIHVEDGLLFGRGSCDMKGFIAICLARIDDILEAELSTPIHFAFSYDEEVGCVGVRGLIDELKRKTIQPRACIIGEPTDMEIIRAHKGMLFKRCSVRGKSAHSSLVDQGVNAVTMAARTITHIDQIARRIQKEGPFDEEFVPPYTTLHCGVVRGGTANNIIPNECQFDFEIRNLPNQPTLEIFEEINSFTEKTLLPQMQAVSKDTSIDWQTLADYPGLDMPIDDGLITMVADLLGTTKRPGKVSYGTEGGHFQNAGFPTIVCGPGNIAQAHKPDEYVTLEQLSRCDQFLTTLFGSLD